MAARDAPSILGGNRIPFARSNGPYAQASNQDMLTAALDGLVARFGLQGERLGEVVAGAVLKHSRDFNLTRECVLGSAARPDDPGLRRPAGLRHRPRRPPSLVANKIALGQIDVGIAGGVDTTSDAPIARQRGPAPACCSRLNRAKTPRGPRSKLLARLRPRPDRARDPAQRRAAHRPVDGRARRRSPPRGGASTREDAGRARRRQPPAASPPPTSAASSTTSSRRTSGSSATRTCAPDSSVEKLAKLKPVFGEGERRDDDRRQLDPADRRRRRSCCWRARSGRGEHGLPVLALPRRTPRRRPSTTSTATRGC